MMYSLGTVLLLLGGLSFPVYSQQSGDVTVDPVNVDPIGQQNEINSLLEPYNYDANNRRDPFKWVFDDERPEGEPKGEETKLLLKSQRFDLEEFSLIGIIWNVDNPRAMFIDPNKELHVLKKDERIGKKNGYIGVIREGEVVVIEPEEIKGKLTYNSKVVPIER